MNAVGDAKKTRKKTRVNYCSASLLQQKLSSKTMFLIFQTIKPKIKRVQAVYDCEADNDDELSFSEGEIIVVSGEADPDWWVSYRECCISNNAS